MFLCMYINIKVILYMRILYNHRKGFRANNMHNEIYINILIIAVVWDIVHSSSAINVLISSLLRLSLRGYAAEFWKKGLENFFLFFSLQNGLKKHPKKYYDPTRPLTPPKRFFFDHNLVKITPKNRKLKVLSIYNWVRMMKFFVNMYFHTPHTCK